MTLPTPGQKRVNYLKLMYERGYVRVLENSRQFGALMQMCELGEATSEAGALAGITKSFTFRLTPRGRSAIEKRMNK